MIVCFSLFSKMLSVTSLNNSGFLMISIKAKNNSSSLSSGSRLPDQIAFESRVLDGIEDHQQIIRLRDILVPDVRRVAEKRVSREVETQVYEYDNVKLLELV